MSSDIPVSSKLKELRNRAGKTIRQMAEDLGYGDSHSTYSSYEGKQFKKPYLPMDMVLKLRPLLVGLGQPPITDDEVLSLGGASLSVAVNIRKRITGGAEKPTAPVEAKVLVCGNPEQAGGDGVEYLGQAYAPLPVYDVMVSAGPGAFNKDHLVPEGWTLLSLNRLRAVTRARLEDLAMIRVSGDSMTPTLMHNDEILVDTSVTKIGRDGMYVVATGEEVQVKRIARDWATKSLVVASDNPMYPTSRGVQEEDLVVMGRVVWISRNVGG